MPRTNDSGRSVSSRLLEVLFAFEPNRNLMSLSDLVAATGIPRATVRRYALELVSQVGGRLPLHCSGVGKILLAHSPPEVVESALARELSAYTSATITDPERLRQELAACRASGTAVVRGERTPDANSYAARIVDGSANVVAALSVVVRAGTVREPAVLPAVLTSGLNISRLLGWRPGTRILHA